MHEPADLLVLDEPTNDLDIPALELLEESLADFPGGLALVTHDRLMLDRVVHHHRRPRRPGRRPRPSPTSPSARRPAAARSFATRPPRPDSAATRQRSRPRRLPYHEQREWEGMEAATILAAEAASDARQRALDDPAIVSDVAALQARHAALDAARAEVARLYARWAELESKQT